jgi:DNA invertase Pin-like site-specific DNA recombinase
MLVGMPPLAAVVRVSHVGARGGDSFHADEDQVEVINEYAAALAADVVYLPPELNMSGGDPINQRPSLLAAIEGCEAGQYSGIIVANLKRLTRSRSGHEIWERVEAAGGSVYCARERLDTSTPQGRKMRDYAIADAVEEREEHAAAHAKRRRKTVEAGVWRQRQVPLGYRFAGPADANGKFKGAARSLVPDERTAPIVQAAFRDRAAGVTISELARRTGLTPSGVRHLLKNRVYLGELKDGENVNPSAHPPLVDVATFEAAQRSVPRPARSSVKNGPALLAGLVRCASCGHLLTRGGSRQRPVYTCAKVHSGASCPRPAAATVALLDAHVEQIALAELARLSVTAHERDTTETAQAAVEAAENELAMFLKVARATDPGYAEAVQDRRDAIDNARAVLRAELAKRAVIPAFESGADVWETLSDHDRNQLLRGLLAAVVVAPAGRGSRMPLAERVRVLRFGADVRLPERRGGEGSGIVPIPLPDVDSPDVLAVAAGEDAL